LDHYPDARSIIDLAAQDGCNICFVDVGSSQETALPLVSQLSENGIIVVAVHGDTDPDLILRCLRRGASEFLVEPIDADQVEAALARLSRKTESPTEVCKLGSIYSFTSGKGACGSTTIAANLALRLPQFGSKRVLLVDLDPITGSVAFLLKLKSKFSFLDAISDWDRMDADLWKRLIVEHQGIDVLLAPETPAAVTPDPQQWSRMVAFWRQIYDAVVIDNPSPSNALSLAVGAICDQLLVVTTNEMAALHSTRKTLLYLDQNGVDAERVKLIVNRHAPRIGLPETALETALNRKVFHHLPNDYDALQKALLDGRPAQPGTEFGKSVAKLAERLTGFAAAPSQQRKNSGLAQLFGSFGGRKAATKSRLLPMKQTG
jgi:pilus assembly protein CpaE